MPPTDTSRKRPSDGGPEDGRPQKRISQGAAAPSSNSASAEESDPPALTSLADGSRRYNEFKGDIAHRGLKLYDEEERGFFHSQGMRTKPDKDGKFRPIVVDRGFRAPGRQDDRQAPAASAAATATAPSPSTAARAVHSSVSTLITPAQTARPSSRNVIDLSSDNEDVKPVVEGTPVGNTASRVPAQREQARGETKNTGTGNRVRKKGHGAMFEVNNPQELGGAQHHRNLFASWKQEAGTHHLEDSSSTSSSEDDDGSDPFDFEPSDLPVLCNEATLHQKTGTDTSPIVLADSKQPSDPSKSAIWRYLMTLTKTEIPVPDDPAITELLTLPKRRDLPKTWQNRVSKFEDFHLTTLTALVLYIGGDEASNSPCKWMGCSVQTEVNAFYEIEFNRGSWIDYSQAQVTPVSSAAASLSNLTMQDTSTAPSTSQQQSRSENSQEAAVFNPANPSPQFLGLQGEETQLLQASKRHTLECTVVAGSMKVKTIKNGGMAITSRVHASKTWTVDPDCQCLVSNFFPAAQEVAVLKVKSKPVLTRKG
ncbi:hypothetical protein N0V85_006799 [Neurospora sp. IMI 360204]|nr:hypothetical protein N0V85_006799 [Neurospora sp. IMI 360204]